MASITLFLRGNYVCIFYSHYKKKWRRSTGVKVDPKYWNERKQWVKQTCPYFDDVQKQLRKEIEKIEDARRAIEKENKEPYPDAIKEYLEKDKLPSNYELLRTYYYEEMSKKTPSLTTMKRYKSSWNHLIKFKLHKKEFTPDILEKYHRFCNKEFSSDNTIQKRVYFLRDFLEWCHKHKYIKWRPDYTIKRTTPDPVSLDSKELEAFIKVPLSGEMDECRDIFLFCAATSLAFADYVRVVDNPHWIYEGMIHNPGRQKTGTPQEIPLNETAREIINKYPDGLPKRASQVLNRNLKTIGKKAQLIKPVTIKRYHNGKPHYSTFKKWELLSIHKARKTFATLGLQKGLQPFAIKEMGGWKDWKSMKPYIDKVETEYLKDEMKKWDQ